MDTLNVPTIAGVMIAITFLEATADIAVDGWVLTILSEEYVVLGPTCQSVGQNLGWYISQFLFVQLTSVRFANTYIYSEPSTEPLVTFSGYFNFWGIFTLILTIIIHVFKKETNPTTREFSSLWEVYSTLKGFYINKNLRFLCLWMLFFRAGFVIMDQAGFLELVRKGLPKETLTNIGIVAYPVQFIIPIVVSKYTLQKLELQMALNGVLIQIVFALGMLLTISQFNGADVGGWTIFCIGVLAIVNQTGRIFMEVSSNSFSTRICDPSLGGTFITALASINTLSRTILQPIGFNLLDIMNFYVLNLCAVGYEIWFRWYFIDRCIELQRAPKEIWSLDHISHTNGYVEMKEAGDSEEGGYRKRIRSELKS